MNPDKGQAPQFSAELLQRVADLNQHDVELYAAAERRFERQWQHIRSFPDGPPPFEKMAKKVTDAFIDALLGFA